MSLADPMKAVHPRTDTLLGIDIGSVTICVVRTDLSGKILATAYLSHKGQIRECLRTAGAQIGLESVRGIAVCAAPCFDPEMVVLQPAGCPHQGRENAEPAGKVPAPGRS